MNFAVLEPLAALRFYELLIVGAACLIVALLLSECACVAWLVWRETHRRA